MNGDVGAVGEAGPEDVEHGGADFGQVEAANRPARGGALDQFGDGVASGGPEIEDGARGQVVGGEIKGYPAHGLVAGDGAAEHVGEAVGDLCVEGPGAGGIGGIGEGRGKRLGHGSS